MENDIFNNLIVDYLSFPSGIKKQIDSFFETIIKNITDKIINCADCDKKRKYIFELNCAKNFEKTKLSLCVITAYSGNEENRYSSILNAINEFLSNNLKLKDATVTRIRRELLEYFQNKFEHNSTISENEPLKHRITRKEILWPVVTYTIRHLDDDVTEEISHLCSFKVDQSFIEDFEDKKEKIDILRCERFEFTSKVIFSYDNFKKTTLIEDNLMKEFIKIHYYDFLDEFRLYGYDEQMTEFITKWFLLLILRENKCIYSTITFLGDNYNAD